MTIEITPAEAKIITSILGIIAATGEIKDAQVHTTICDFIDKLMASEFDSLWDSIDEQKT